MGSSTRSIYDKQELLSLPPHTAQDQIQKKLEVIHRKFGLIDAMDCLFRWELEAGYITEEKLNSCERHTFRDRDSGIRFRLQVNYARSGYTPTAVNDPSRPPVHCSICAENVGRPGKDFLRIYEFSLGDEPFFLQLTPYPLFTHHFVLILTEPRPQNVDASALSQMFRFLEMAPSYTLCSNSDIEWAGSSILEHQHFQVFRNLHLPVMEAKGVEESSIKHTQCRLDLLDYPMAAIRISGKSPEAVEREGWQIIEKWKGLQPGKNTVNLVLSKRRRSIYLYIFLRNPDFRTPAELLPLKQEGVGVIEAAGEVILPVPKDPRLWRAIRDEGLQVIKGIIEGNSPFKADRWKELWDLLT